MSDGKFAKGDSVLYKNPVRTDKFDEIWKGPYKVVDTKGVTTKIRMGRRVKFVHNNKLKPFNGDVAAI